MEPAAPFAGYEATVICLRRFMHDAYNMTVLRKVLYADSYQFGIHSLSDQEVISQVARKAVRGQIFIARGKAAQYGGGSSSPSVKEVVQAEGKKWSKQEYIKSFLEESKSTPPAVEPAQETNWVAFKVLYDDTDEPVAGVDLKIKLPDGTTDIYTTDGAGKIYISGLPDGTCDVQEMLDNDALEVVEVLAG
ncbi:MAG: hypothetical protein D3917_05610 [Candidatus Electrothrix sp. AX5]|nr:hypothetical protein [Candidatus Electrothrix sp. AX5]